MRLIPRIFSVSSLLVLLIFMGYSQGGVTGTKTLTIRGSDADPGDTIEMSDTATVTVATGADGIVVTLPDVDVRMRCLGDVTADGYCYLAAGGGGEVKDNDGDGIPDDSDDCDFTPSGAWTNSAGCSDLDNDGVHGIDDKCPDQPGPVSNDGCPVVATTYVVTPTVSGGNGTISPSTPQTVQENLTTTFTLTPSDGYEVDSVAGCGGTLAGLVYTTGQITSNCSVTASFKAESTTGGVEYCQGKTSDVECSTAKTLDPLGNSTVYQQVPPDSNRVTNGKVLSVPFTYMPTSSSRTSARIKMASNMSVLQRGFEFNVWISRRANGVALESGSCSAAYLQVEGQYLELSDQGGRFSCGLASGEVYHANFEVRCSSTGVEDNPAYDQAITESVWAREWISGTRYTTSTLVAYRGGLYEAKQVHTASASQAPSTECSNCDESGAPPAGQSKDYDNAIWNYKQPFNPKTLPLCPDPTKRWDSSDYNVTGGFYFELSSF